MVDAAFPRIFIFLIIFFHFKILLAQTEFSFPFFSFCPKNGADFSAGISGDASLNSPDLKNNFFYQFNKNGKITEEGKNLISDKLSTSNRIGADGNYGLFFSQKLNCRNDSVATESEINSSWNYFIRIADRTHFDARFPKDLFDLAFYGNQKFKGDTAFLDNTSLNYLRYQQLQLGIIHSNEKKLSYGISFSLLKGEENYLAQLNRVRFFTDENGEKIALDFRGEGRYTNPSNKGFGAINGWGFSTSLFAGYPIKLIEHNTLVSVEMNDFGFIRWDNKSNFYKADTTLQFSGINISDIFLLNDSVLKSISPDSLTENINSLKTNSKYLSYLPAVLKGSWLVDWNKFSFGLGLAYRIKANYHPYFLLKSGYKISKIVSLSTLFSEGGYGKFGFGVEAALKLKKLSLAAGSNNLEGLVFKNISGGTSGYLSAIINF